MNLLSRAPSVSMLARSEPAAVEKDVWTPASSSSRLFKAKLASRFEVAAICSAEIEHQTNDVIGVLLTAAAESGRLGGAELRPIWAEEAMHRAYSTLRLFTARNRRRDVPSALGSRLDLGLANHLATNLRTLASQSSEGPIACSTILREISRDLVALFGPGAGVVDIHTHIDQVSLPQTQMRALALLAYELISNSLLHAFDGTRSGRIYVDLRVVEDGLACLRVADDGKGFAEQESPSGCGVAVSLASVLDTELHTQSSPRGVRVCVYFRIPRPAIGQ